MDYSALEKCRLFRGLSAEEIERGIGDIPCHVKRYEEGETICPLMAKADQVGIILRGSAQSHQLHPNGDQINFTVRQAGDLIGPAAVFSRMQRYPLEVRALEPTEVLTFERTGILRLLHGDIRVMENFISELASANFLLQQRLELMTYSAIRQKIAFYLLMGSPQAGTDRVRVPGSMTKWALTLNVSRPSLHRELRKLEAMGFVRYRPPDIEILDAEGLRSTLMQ